MPSIPTAKPEPGLEPSPAPAAPAAPGWGAVVVLAGLAALGPFTIDTYLPALPALQEAFGVDALQAQATLSAYLVALAVASLFHGALSDAYGRRPVLLGALALYVVTALGCAVAPSFAALLALRIVQGLSAGAGMIIGRAVIRDRYDGPAAQRLMAHVTMLFGIAPAVAPILGGYLYGVLGWRSVFVFLAILGAGLLLMTFRALPESLPADGRQPFRPAPLLAGYLEVARHPGFLALALSLGLGFGGFLVYVAGAHDVVVEVLGLSERSYGWLFLPAVSGLVAGSWAAGRLSDRLPPQRMITAGFALMVVASVLNLGYHVLRPAAVPWSVLPLPLFTFGVSLQMPAVTILALDLFPHRRGLAASVQSFLQTMVFAFLSSAVVPLLFGSAARYAFAMAAMVALNGVALAVYRAWRSTTARTAAVARVGAR